MSVHHAIVKVHDKALQWRRARVFATHIVEMLPADCVSLLDVGCGEGAIDSLVLEQRPGLAIRGMDVFVRPTSHIPVEVFDGSRIPMPDQSCDVLMMVDVLHHTNDPHILLAEARRVARRGLLIKDHTRENWLAGKKLAFMDWVGNRGHGVYLPYNYWSMAQWQEAWSRVGWKVEKMRRRLDIYSPWIRPFFETNLHFIAYLTAAEIPVPTSGAVMGGNTQKG